MKAKFVYENMDFERGRDPKQSIGIGRWAQIKREYEEDNPWQDYSHEEALSWAAGRGKIEYVNFLLKNGVDPNYNEGKPLQAGIDNPEITRMFLDAGMKPKALTDALDSSYTITLETAKLLIDAGPKLTDDIIHSMIWNENAVEIIKYLFSKGVKIKNHSQMQSSLAHKLTPEMLKVFLDNGLKLKKNDNDLFLSAASDGQVEVVKMLLDLGFKAKGELGGEALIQASESDANTEMVELLINAGADPNTIGEESTYYVERYSALTRAAEWGNTEIVKLLLDAGADIHILNDKAHRIARKNGHTETLEFIKDYKKRGRMRAKQKQKV